MAELRCSSATTPEAEAFQKYFARLVEACTPELDKLVLQFYSNGFISDQVKSEITWATLGVSRSTQTDRLLSAVKSVAAYRSDRMDLFVNILRESPPLQDVADDLDECVTQLREQVKQEGRLTPPSLPRITSTGFRQQRSGSFTSLEVEFSCLRAELIASLEDDEKSLSMMRNALRDWEAKPEFKKIVPGSLENARTVEEFVVALKPTCLDCTLLYIAVRAQRNTAAKEKLEKYFQLKEKTPVPIRMQEEEETSSVGDQNGTAITSNYSIAKAVIQEEVLSGKQYEETTSWLSYVWKIPRVALSFLYAEKGSIVLRWQIDASLESHIGAVPITGHALKVLSGLRVTRVTLGDSYQLEIPNLAPEAEESMYSSEAVFSAASAGDSEMTERLIRGGASPNIQDVDGSTALHSACDHKHTKVVLALLAVGADPNLPTHDGWSSLMSASRLDATENVDKLLKAGANPNAVNDEDWTALMAAARNGRLGNVVKLLEYKAALDMQDCSGWSALMAAVWNGHEEIAFKLIDAGATPNIQDKNGTNALFLAIYRQQPQVINALMARHPSVNLQDTVGETALMYACKMKDLDSVTILLERGANPNALSAKNETALLFATQRIEVRIVEELVKAGADPNFKTENRISALMLAAKEGSVEMVDILLRYHAQPDLVDEASGYTALMFAAEAGHSDTVESLLRANAQVSRTNKGGASAYYLAYQNRHADVAKILHQAHVIQTASLPVNPSATGHRATDTAVEVLSFVTILLNRLQRPPLLMEPDITAELGKKRSRWAASGRQGNFIQGPLLAVGTS